MTYITPKGYQGICLSGRLSIHENSPCESQKGIIYWCGTPVCFETSEDAHQFFARNDDGMGKLRYADTYAGGIYIYAKEQPSATVNIASVVCTKGA